MCVSCIRGVSLDGAEITISQISLILLALLPLKPIVIQFNFFDYKELSLKSYCKVFDGEFFIMYFKKENTSCEEM